MKNLLLFSFSCLIFLFSCEKDAPIADSIAQVSRLDSLAAGHFDGNVSYKTLDTYGDFGLGTFNGLDGEMIYLDNQFYQVRVDGLAYPVEDTTKSPFANITYFEVDQTELLDQTLDFAQLQNYLDSLIIDHTAYYAIKITGTFTQVKTRSVHHQEEPYPTLSEVIANQVTFDFENIDGTMVGFRFPNEVEGANVQGYHFHFLTADKRHGGHLLECTIQDAEISIDHTTGIEILGQ